MNQLKIQGFTLIELMISIAIIGIVFGVIITSAGSIQKGSRDTQRQSHLRTIQSALEQFRADNNYYPPNLYTGANSLNSPKPYLNPIPVDPSNSSPYPYAADPAACPNPSPCSKYCLYAKLENVPNPTQAPTGSCVVTPTQNTYVNQP